MRHQSLFEAVQERRWIIWRAQTADRKLAALFARNLLVADKANLSSRLLKAVEELRP